MDTGTVYHWGLDLTIATTPTTTTTTTLHEDTGFVPSDKTIAKCEGKASKAAGKLTAKIAACHAKSGAARAAGKTFDEEGCEAKAKAAFAASKGNGCPPCLADRAAIADVIERAADGWNGSIFCEGTTPF
jgi:hypothetical protein